MAKIDGTQFCKDLILEHEKRWPYGAMREHRLFHRAYMTQFWKDTRQANDSDIPPIETSHAYRHIESIINSLYGRAPAVQISLGVRGLGNPKIAQALVNDWLSGTAREIQEMASRVALIWPFTVFKLFKRADASDVWDKVDLTYILPWDVYVDPQAKHWHQQEYVGDKYWIRLTEALRMFPKTIDADWTGEDAVNVPNSLQETTVVKQTFEDVTLGTMVQIHEIYLPKQNRRIFYSEQYKDGNELISDDKIPIKDFAGRVLTPYVPLMYSTDPADPLKGYAAMSRIYDQIVEMNLDRSALAEQVRKSARVLVSPKGSLDDHAKRAIRAGRDGTVIELDVKPDEVRNAIIQLPVTELGRGLLEYGLIIGNDLTESQNTAGFTRGEALNTTATEINTLNVYTSTELGRFARIRDESFVRLARVYLGMLYLFVDSPDAIVLDKKTVVVSPEDIIGDFLIEVSESQSTPQAREIKKQEYLALLPVLQALQVPVPVLVENLIKLFDLDPKHAETAPAPALMEPELDKNALVNGGPAGANIPIQM